MAGQLFARSSTCAAASLHLVSQAGDMAGQRRSVLESGFADGAPLSRPQGAAQLRSRSACDTYSPTFDVAPSMGAGLNARWHRMMKELHQHAHALPDI